MQKTLKHEDEEEKSESHRACYERTTVDKV